MRYLIILLFTFHIVNAQNNTIPDIKTAFPEIAGPSPTVAGLMKFEEVPVDNYTGIPDISIPLYSIKSQGKTTINLSLNYHPYSVALSEVASYSGLGWSLFAGGTISRTVKGKPDEYFDNNNNVPSGIYQDVSMGTFGNHYYESLGVFQGNLQLLPVFKKMLWETFFKGRYDMEHDLYQFNFMGRSGRFIIRKNTLNDFEVVQLGNDNALKIQFHKTFNSNTHTYTFLGFTITDEDGYKYFFDQVENTSQATVTQNEYYGGVNNISGSQMEFTSAFHLSKIQDHAGVSLVEFVYNGIQEPIKEIFSDVSTERNYTDMIPLDLIDTHGGSCDYQLYRYEPHVSSTRSVRSVNTKKLKQIKIIGKANIDIVQEQGRQDYNLQFPENSYRLKNIIVYDWNNNPVKKYSFDHTYSEINSIYGKRMMLSAVHEENFQDSQKLSYHLSYGAKPNEPSLILGKDNWGFLNAKPYFLGNGTFREATPNSITTDVLQKMTLPTGGAIVYDFGSNTYSHIGSTEITDYYENFENWNYSQQSMSFTSAGGLTPAQYFDVFSVEDFKAKFYVNATAGNSTGVFNIYREVNGVNSHFTSFNCNELLNCESQELSFPPGSYSIRYQWLNIDQTSSVNVIIDYRTKKIQNLQKYIYGGGLRINNIGWFEDSTVSQEYFKNVLFQYGHVPLRSKNISYQFGDDESKSSGSLVYGKPVFTYNKLIQADETCSGSPRNFIPYITVSSYNNLKSLRTKGADVGYKNVSIKESGKGKSAFTYTSPIDFPADANAYTVAPPFVASRDLDYKRGLVTIEKHYREDGKLLSETDYNYEIIEDEIMTGIQAVRGVTQSISNARHYTFEDWQNTINYCNSQPDWLWIAACRNLDKEDTYKYVSYFQLWDSFGWIKKITKTTKEYFDFDTFVETTQETSNNSFNKMIESQKIFMKPDQTKFKQSIFSYHNFGTNAIRDVYKIENFDETGLLNSKTAHYNSAWSGVMRKELNTVLTSKNNQPDLTIIRYNRYDTYGHPLEVQQENGIKISYIYGYNQTEPVAKIDNMAYASIPQYLITAIHSAANETAMTTALDNLRNTLSNSMVTTYTYKPLVGVTSITDPKGDKITYEYDSFGRLNAVRDKDNNLLSENEYKYRTQN